MNNNHTRKFQFRMTEEEYTRLRVISMMNGTKPSDGLRTWINSNYITGVAIIEAIPDDDRRLEALAALKALRDLAERGTAE